MPRPLTTMRTRRLSWLVLFLAAFAALGYCREFFFVNLNNIMYMKYYHTGNTVPVPSVMHVFESVPYATLYYSKYIYTVLWVAVFFFLNYFTVKKLTHAPALTRSVVWAY